MVDSIYEIRRVRLCFLMLDQRLVYRFGVFEVLPEAGQLLRRGQPVRIQEQPFSLLVALLEHPNRVLSRKALARRLWPENTYVEFDQSLSTAVTKLRQALGDEATNPLFVETVPRRGYRFIAPVGVERLTNSNAHSLSNLPTPTGSASTSIPATEPMAPLDPFPIDDLPVGHANRSRRAILWIAASVATLALVAGGVLAIRTVRQRATYLKQNDAVVLQGFENSTGNALFDDTLSSALRIKFEESPFFTVLPERSIGEATPSAPNQPDSSPTFSQVLAACRALHGRVVLRGSISSSPTGLRLKLDAISCATERVVASEESTAPAVELVLGTLGSLSDALRRDLGEPLDLIARFDTPIALATTSSLSALRAFSQGERKRVRGLDYETLNDYKLAADLDPQFALAFARMGVIYTNANEPEQGAANYARAYELREHTTERERLYITSHYDSVTLGDIEKAVQVYQLWRQLYPRDLVAPVNLADIYEVLGQPELSLAMGREALAINPNHAFSYAAFLQAAQRLGRFDEAREVGEQAAKKNLDNTLLFHMALYRIGVAQNDNKLMQEQMDWARGNPREGELLNLEATARLAAGQIGESVRLYHKAQEDAIRNGLNEFAADIGLDLAGYEADIGLNARAREEVRHSLQLAPKDRNTRAFSALVLADIGDTSQATRLIEGVRKDAPIETIYTRIVLPIAESLNALRKSDARQALSDLAPVGPYDRSRATALCSFYYRAQAYAAAQQPADAAREFQRILENRNLFPESPYIALAHLGIARARIAAGDRSGAQAEYSTFVNLWHGSDAPIFRQANAEMQEIARRRLDTLAAFNRRSAP